jgi:hypothetical protein
MHRPVTVFSAAFSEIGLKILQKKIRIRVRYEIELINATELYRTKPFSIKPNTEFRILFQKNL